MSKTLLIVDDLFSNRLLLSKLISELGYKHLEAKDGKRAVELIEESEFDLVLMDIEMPIMNGIEAIKYIREELGIKKSELPVVAVTAHEPESFHHDFNEIGFNGIFGKPFTLSRFKEMIHKYLS